MSLQKVPPLGRTTSHVGPFILSWAIMGHCGWYIDMATLAVYDSKKELIVDSFGMFQHSCIYLGWVSAGPNSSGVIWSNMPHDDAEKANTVRQLLLQKGYSNSPEIKSKF